MKMVQGGPTTCTVVTAGGCTAVVKLRVAVRPGMGGTGSRKPQGGGGGAG